MFSDKVYLNSWYPFLPSDAITDVIKNIRDIRIVRILDAMQPSSTYVNQSDFTLYFTGFCLIGEEGEEELVSSFMLNCPVYGISSDVIYVPIYTLNEYPSTANYIIVDQMPSVTAEMQLQVHPDCITFMQKAPALYFCTRTDIHKTDDSATVSAPISCSAVAFDNGYNITTIGDSYRVLLIGGESLGLGKFTTSPFIDAASTVKHAPRGVLSINGITEYISVYGTQSIQVTTPAVLTGSTINMTLSLQNTGGL